MENTEHQDFKEFLISVVGHLNIRKIEIDDYEVINNISGLNISSDKTTVKFTIKLKEND